jgi:hypothetical protein
MARRVRRPRPARAARAPRTPGEQQTTVGAVGGGELKDAAEEIADGARKNASWSRQISGGIQVDIDGQQATIWTDAGPAYPAETRARHPLFGNRAHWYGPPGQRFHGPAADDRAGPAMAKYAKKIDQMCRDRGFR